jgi:endoglucanase
MRKTARLVTMVFLVSCCVQTTLGQQEPTAGRYYDWLGGPKPNRPVNNPEAKKLPLVQVKGNRFVNALGDTVLFRGLGIADPDKLEQEGHWNKTLFEKAKEMGAMIVRIPVHPVPWRMRTPAQYLGLVDQAVEWCTELGMYVIIDWHSIGNLGMELFQDPVYNTTRRETYEFWRTIASHFKGNNTVAFYELFNEPTLFNGQLGSMSWSEWKEINEKIIRLIRAYDNETIPLVAGLDWAYDLTPLHIEPIEADGIGYVVHPYPHKREKPYEPRWDEDFGFAVSKYPVVATEFGFVLGKQGMVDNGDYGRRIIKYLEAKGISWVCWVFDPLWGPSLLQSWDNFKLTESGEFFKRAMHGHLDE